MLVTNIWCLYLAVDVGDGACHKHPKLAINTFCLQHPSPTSMSLNLKSQNTNFWSQNVFYDVEMVVFEIGIVILEVKMTFSWSIYFFILKLFHNQKSRFNYCRTSVWNQMQCTSFFCDLQSSLPPTSWYLHPCCNFRQSSLFDSRCWTWQLASHCWLW